MSKKEIEQYVQNRDEFEDIVMDEEMQSIMPIPRMNAYNETDIKILGRKNKIFDQIEKVLKNNDIKIDP